MKLSKKLSNSESGHRKPSSRPDVARDVAPSCWYRMGSLGQTTATPNRLVQGIIQGMALASPGPMDSVGSTVDLML